MAGAHARAGFDSPPAASMGKVIRGMNVTEELKREVWNKGTVCPGLDPNEWRMDAFGNLIAFSMHGNRDSDYGWEIDHILPVMWGGDDGIHNLRPLQWGANAAR